jgi:hypothetical protein
MVKIGRNRIMLGSKLGAGHPSFQLDKNRRLTMKARIYSILLLAFMIFSCSSGSGDSGGSPHACGGPAVVTWTDGAWTQPVPAWGSATRLSSPPTLSSISMGDLGAFGSHQGGHPEGLDHVWIYNTADDQVRSWADGTVTRIDVYSDQTMITIDYGGGLIGKHMSVQTSRVSVGQRVKAGDVVAQGISGSLNNEFQLMDENRCDGVKTDVNGYSYVSPFDYLVDSQKTALVAQYQAQVATPYFANGRTTNAGKPWEPYLTNKTLFHSNHRGTIIGEWVLSNKGWNTPDPLYFDILTVNDVTNAYGHFSKFSATDYNSSSPANKGIVDGDFTLSSQTGQVIFTYSGSATPNWYGLYSVDESSRRAIMRLEWSRQDFPAAITSNAAIYYERAPIYVYRDAQLLGALK